MLFSGSTKIGDWDVHPYAACLPEMEGEDLANTEASIRKYGLWYPIVLFRDMIVDGRQRLKLCLKAGIKPRFTEWRSKGVTEEEIDRELRVFIIVTNVHRRHLKNQSQKAMAATDVMRAPRPGRPPKPSGNADGKTVGDPTLTQDAAARSAGVSRELINLASQVKKKGSAKLNAAIKSGEVMLNDAANVIHLPHKEQNAALKAKLAGEARTVTAVATGRTERGHRNQELPGASDKTEFFTLVAEGPWPAEIPAHAVDQFEKGHPGWKVKAIAKKGQDPRPFERCTRPGCDQWLFEGDPQKVVDGQVRCRQCPDGKSR